jgi:hypothetical protein
MFLAVIPRLVLTLTFGQPEVGTTAPPAPDPAATLRTCDALLAEGKRAPARTCFEDLRRRYPATPEAHDADRALSLMNALAPPPPAPAAPPPPSPQAAPGGSPESFYVLEPYSVRTKERLRLTTWEKLDFGISAFIYGLSTGASFGGASNSDNIVAPMVVGALTYTSLAAIYMNTAQVDRGDLPLTLAITSYIPLTAGLVALTTETQDGRAAASMIAASGVVSLPIAYYAAAHTDLDPGDTQLVRDSGFWGAVIGASGALANRNPRARTVGIAGLVGLYGGMGLGFVAAQHSDISLERVRVTTWGGYGGALLGGLVSLAGNNNDESEVFRDIAIGSALGLIVTFASTGSIDDAPANARFNGPGPVSLRYLEPAVVPVMGRDGRYQARPGLTLARGRF